MGIHPSRSRSHQVIPDQVLGSSTSLIRGRMQGVWRFFSVPQPQNPYENSSSLGVVADFHTKFPLDNKWIHPTTTALGFPCGYASGLIYFSAMSTIMEDDNAVPMICNPNTGQYASYSYVHSFLGFDPIDKQFKVLFISNENDQRILTLERGKMRWRKIKCPLTHMPCSNGICIKGVVYYLAHEVGKTPYDERRTYEIICFDVRYEKFKFIKAKFSGDLDTKLIDYKGKLCVIYCKYEHLDAMELWVLEDVEKQEWSKYVYTLPENKFDDRSYVSVVGVTATGEIVLSSEYYTSSPFYVFYFNPERNTLQSVEINGFRDESDEMSISAGFGNTIYTFLNHVEDLNVNDGNLFKSSISAPSRKFKSSIDMITKRPKPQYGEAVREKRDMRMRYDDSVSREWKHIQRYERDNREDEDTRRRRRRRREEEARDRERRVESRRDRDDHWSDIEYKEKKRERDRSRGRGEMRDRERRVESRRNRDNYSSDKEYKERRRKRDSREDEDISRRGR